MKNIYKLIQDYKSLHQGSLNLTVFQVLSLSKKDF